MSSQVTEPKLVQPAQPEQPEQPEQSGEQESQSGSEDPDADPVFTPIFETGEMEMSEEVRDVLTPEHPKQLTAGRNSSDTSSSSIPIRTMLDGLSPTTLRGLWKEIQRAFTVIR